jgi:hypothetical protein
MTVEKEDASADLHLRPSVKRIGIVKRFPVSVVVQSISKAKLIV